jgi:hypothetical protein
MPAAAMREVIGILKTWSEIRYQLHEREADAIFGGYGTDFEARSRGGRPGNPTQTRALRLATDPETRQLERLNGAIERALADVAGGNGKTSRIAWALRMLYLGNHAKTDEGRVLRVAKTLEVSRQTVWRWDRQFKTHLWEQLGRAK